MFPMSMDWLPTRGGYDRLERRDEPPDLLDVPEEEEVEPDAGDDRYHSWADEHEEWEDWYM